MGEVGVSVELEAAEAEMKKDESGGSAAVLRWERFLAKMAVRVLLVEADDSTRQIINALLRKCGYKVTAVSDGLKAWELLKKKPHNVDLVLAEADLPSISGYALLTLIMEHEICKNIPVIMMSSHDSVSTVYGCMLRGAADFLVKPIRKNELTNLWQHVWRRQASSGGVRAVDESVAQQKVEAMDENNAISNGECREKGSEAQSSCSKPDIDTETENTEHIQDLLQPNWDKSLPRVDQASDEDPAQIKSCKQGIDFIGAFDDYLKCNYINSSSNTSPSKVDSAAALDLSLTRSYPSSLLNQFADKHRLNHSDGSAFTPYVNKGVQNRGLTLPIPVREVRFEGLSNGYSPVISPTDSPGSGRQDSPLEPNPVHPFNHHAITSMQFTGLVDQNGDLATTQTEKNQSEPTDECRHFSSATDQSGNSSLCSGRTQVPIVISTAECRKEEVSLVQDGNSQRSSQREAALTKFRLKRKDRCYEKKVRYESRKKLAEQRPRVKGQFVRRQPTGPPPGDNELISTAINSH